MILYHKTSYFIAGAIVAYRLAQSGTVRPTAA